jgi:voltage-gated potassium channel Kch
MLNIILWTVVFEFIGLPPAMGAFLAGMLLSETIYRHQVQADISPYQIMFLSFFFIALGMGLNLPLLIENWWLIGFGVLGLICIKFAAIYMVARVRHVMTKDAFMISLILAQGGEFGLLILQTMKTNGIAIIPGISSEIIIAIIVVSMMMTPILLAIYDLLRSNGTLFKRKVAEKANKKDVSEIKPEVIVCGFGRVGQTVAQMLKSEKIPYAAIDMDVDSVMMGREAGFNVFYGDTKDETMLIELGLAPRRTRAVVIALDNAAISKRTVRAVRNIAPRVRIFARARNSSESDILRREGVLVALPETIESSFILGQEVLGSLGVNDRDIEELLASMRTDNYKSLADILEKHKH